MKKLLSLILMLFIFSCREKAEGYNLDKSMSEEDNYTRSVDSSIDSNVPEPDSDFIYTTTTAIINKDTIYTSKE